MNWYLKVIKQYADFNGRARRKEYWMFFLFNVLVGVVLGIFSGIGKAMDSNVISIFFSVISYIYSLAVLVPVIAVGVRRLHDINKSGMYLLICFIPIVGAIVLLVWFIKEGDKGSNQYGTDPKGGDEVSEIGTVI